MAFKSLERAALWTGTGFCGVGAACFAVNAGATLLNHPERTGELYGMATAAAIFIFLTSQLREKLRERRSTQQAISAPADRTALAAGAPEWYAMRGVPADAAHVHVASADVEGVQAVPARIERDCPYCAERILVAAKICKHCRSDVSTA